MVAKKEYLDCVQTKNRRYLCLAKLDNVAPIEDWTQNQAEDPAREIRDSGSVLRVDSSWRLEDRGRRTLLLVSLAILP